MAPSAAPVGEPSEKDGSFSVPAEQPTRHFTDAEVRRNYEYILTSTNLYPPELHSAVRSVLSEPPLNPDWSDKGRQIAALFTPYGDREYQGDLLYRTRLHGEDGISFFFDEGYTYIPWNGLAFLLDAMIEDGDYPNPVVEEQPDPIGDYNIPDEVDEMGGPHRQMTIGEADFDYVLDAVAYEAGETVVEPVKPQAIVQMENDTPAAGDEPASVPDENPPVVVEAPETALPTDTAEQPTPPPVKGNTTAHKNFRRFQELFPEIVSGQYEYLRLEAGEAYRNEMEYKMEHDADALLKKMAGISFVVNPTRQNAITRGTLAEEEFTGDMDDAAWHLESIQEKGLPVNEINAYNHMAIYLRWCIEHDLMSAEFMERYWEQVQPFMADLSRADLRGFIRDQLKGQLFGALFNKEGAAFAGYYYGEADSPYFPSDIDNYALEYFGSEQYYSDKFQDEAYLFIPFDENYYQAMAKVMEKRFANWQGQSFDEATLEPSDLAEAMMEYLDCECTYFPSMTDDDPIMSAYNYAKRESVKEGFVPVLIKADDEILWECLIMNSNPDSDGEDDFAFDPDKVAEYRKKMLSAPVENSKAVLEEMIGQRKEEAEDDDMDWDEEILGEMEGGYDNRRFSSYWNSDNNMTYPLILAKIPVKNPWEIFAYLPFGGWNECPDTPELMAVAKYWFEQHGAVPAAMSHDELEFLLPAPVSEKEAIDVAVELYGFCPDVIDQGPEDATVGALADVLRQSTVWYFWWD